MSEPQSWLSNAHMRLALRVFETLLGRTGQAAVLHLAGLERYLDQPPPDNDRLEVPRADLMALFSGIVSMFGEQGARGVFRRWGRAFAARRANHVPALRLLRVGLRLLPAERSARFVLERLLHHIGLARAEAQAPLQAQGEYFWLTLSDCLYCPAASLTPPNTLIVVGLLEGLLHWATRRDYDVSLDRPDALTFAIRKRPLGPH